MGAPLGVLLMEQSISVEDKKPTLKVSGRDFFFFLAKSKAQLLMLRVQVLGNLIPRLKQRKT